MNKRGPLASLLAATLVSALGSVTLAQSPSSPPWLGGRIEMPEHGFAVTLPDDWVGLDPAADALGQRDAASGFLDPLLWSTDDDAEWVDGLAAWAELGFELWSSDTTREDSCGLGSWISAVSPAEAADAAFEWHSDDPNTRDAESPRRVDLPAGPAYLIRMTRREDPDSDEWWPVSSWVLGAGGMLIEAYCQTDEARPEDDWLSIVETIEFLPVEKPSPPPWLGGRVEVPAHGFAVTLPVDWAGFDTDVDIADGQRAAAAGFLDPAAWSTDQATWNDGLAAQASKGVALWAAHADSRDSCELGPSPLDMSFTDAVFRLFERYTEDDDTRDVRGSFVQLPTGTAYLIHMTERAGPDSDEWWQASHYLHEMEGVLLEAYCSTWDDRPADDWLSIVETFEILPTAE